MIVYKGQGINWHPQSDSLGDSSFKADSIQLPTFVSSSKPSSEWPEALTCFVGLFQVHSQVRVWQGQVQAGNLAICTHTCTLPVPIPMQVAQTHAFA